jgi:uncharacterized protein (TIGR03067 family)
MTRLILCLALALPTGLPTPAARAEVPKLDGVWEGWVVEGKGERNGPLKLRLTIAGDRMTSQQIGGGHGSGKDDLGEGTFKLTDGQPQHLDATRTARQGPKNYLGIVAIEGDTLKWCVATGRKRPADFQTFKGQFLMHLTRQKDAK